MLKAVVFDLDDTLYDQYDYLKGAFRESARFLSYRLNLDEDYLLRCLLEISKAKGSDQGKIFDLLIHNLQVTSHAKELIDGAVDAFLSYHPAELEAYAGVHDVLESLKNRKIKLGLLTDGRSEIQNSKLKALSLFGYFDAIVVSDDYGRENRRPAPFTYQLVLRKLESQPHECVFVADNPKKDFVTAKKMGILTVRTLTGEYRNLSLDDEYEADYSIPQIKELQSAIAAINRVQLKKYYEKVGSSEEKASTYESELPSKRFFFSERMKVILKKAQGFHSPFLNIGCGLGIYEENLNLNSVSVDISKAFLNKAKRSKHDSKGREFASFVQADAAKLPFKKGVFKSILCSEVLEHLPEPLTAICEIRRVADRNCRCIISVPSPYSFAEKERQSRLKKTGKFNDHIYLFTPLYLRNTLTRYDLEIESLTSTFFFPPVSIGVFNRNPRLLRLFLVQDILGRLPIVRYLGWSLIYTLQTSKNK
ncbi:MAG: HAD-IA family hydrolase [Candidatus Bathyarchaeota archaeon]|nr:HAD-IA family hydrolase [Candidatus Bathyarchaeota archaeon]